MIFSPAGRLRFPSNLQETIIPNHLPLPRYRERSFRLAGRQPLQITEPLIRQRGIRQSPLPPPAGQQFPANQRTETPISRIKRMSFLKPHLQFR